VTEMSPPSCAPHRTPTQTARKGTKVFMWQQRAVPDQDAAASSSLTCSSVGSYPESCQLTPMQCRATCTSIWRQSSSSSSGPLTATCVVASSLSSGSGVTAVFLFTGSPDRVSPLSRPGTRPDVRSVIHDHQLEDWHRVVVSRCLSATGIRFSVILRPPGSWALLTVGLPAFRPDLDGVSAFRTHELRPGWAPSIPRGRRCSSRPMATSGRRLPLRSGQSLRPATIPPTRILLNEESTRVQAIRPSGLPQPVAARMERAALGLAPRASHPADRSRTTHAEVGTGHRARTWNYRSTHIRRSPIR
jgi:hypothetical protein